MNKETYLRFQGHMYEAVRGDLPPPYYPLGEGEIVAPAASQELESPYTLDYKPYYPFGAASRRRLETVAPALIYICNKVADVYDISVIWGPRDEIDQNTAYTGGFSKAQWPHSKHNSIPSQAVDIAPYPIDWHKLDRFDMMLGAVEYIAQEANIGYRLGKYFDINGGGDYSHIELTG
jgi:hypothetical protein